MAKQVALHNNFVIFANEAWVQYLTDTLPGSSGAPVFDVKWNVVAVHHAGGDLALPGTKQLVYRNRGTPISLVLARMTEMLGVPVNDDGGERTITISSSGTRRRWRSRLGWYGLQRSFWKRSRSPWTAWASLLPRHISMTGIVIN